jgi:hypothetical protein
MIGSISKNTLNVTGACVATITMSKAIKDATRLTSVAIIFDSGNRYFGIYTFFIRAPPLIIDCMELLVDDEKKLYTVKPDKRYTGKFRMSD